MIKGLDDHPRSPRPPKISDMADHPAERSGIRETFTAFYESWVTKNQEFQEKLLEFEGEENECTEMVAKVLEHYQEFFLEKSKAASEDVFLVMSPPWFTSFERTLIWISAFRPSMVFPLIKHSIGEELSAIQVKRVELMKADIGRKEKEVEKELARIQERVVGDGIFHLSRRFERLVDGKISELDTAMEELKAAMLVVVENADSLRGLTIKKVLKVLEPFQKVKFLAAVGQFMVRARRWGLYKDSQSATTTSTEEASTSHA